MRGVPPLAPRFRTPWSRPSRLKGFYHTLARGVNIRNVAHGLMLTAPPVSRRRGPRRRELRHHLLGLRSSSRREPAHRSLRCGKHHERLGRIPPTLPVRVLPRRGRTPEPAATTNRVCQNLPPPLHHHDAPVERAVIPTTTTTATPTATPTTTATATPQTQSLKLQHSF